MTEPRQSAAEWWQLPREWHFLAVLLLVLLALLRWPFLTARSPLGDESVYLEAFELVLAGESPYDARGFFYPPPRCSVPMDFCGSPMPSIGPTWRRGWTP